MCTLKNACKKKQLHTIYTSNQKFTQSIHEAQTPTKKLKSKKKKEKEKLFSLILAIPFQVLIQLYI
jgi:hypothetical protein